MATDLAPIPEIPAGLKDAALIGRRELNKRRFRDVLCPEFFANKGAIFVPFSSRIVARALTWERKVKSDWSFKDHVYINLGYDLIGDTAVMPPPTNPFKSGRPPWTK